MLLRFSSANSLQVRAHEYHEPKKQILASITEVREKKKIGQKSDLKINEIELN